MLSECVVSEVTQQLLQSVIVEGWTLEGISEQACRLALPEIDWVILEHVLRLMCVESTSLSNVWVLCTRKIMAASARLVFREKLNAGQKLVLENITFSSFADLCTFVQVPVKEFLRDWALQTPGVLREDQLDLGVLRGLALSEIVPGQPSSLCYQYFPLFELSPDAKVRVLRLFILPRNSHCPDPFWSTVCRASQISSRRTRTVSVRFVWTNWRTSQIAG